MSATLDMPVGQECRCGSPLRWECQGSGCGQRWMALCSNSACGWITTAPGTEHGLRGFLLGNAPVARYLKPWSRLYFKTSATGLDWHPHTGCCEVCASELAVVVNLAYHNDTETDPARIILCLACGAIATVSRRTRTMTLLATDGDAWDAPTPPIQALKHALEDRAASRHDDYTWDFG